MTLNDYEEIPYPSAAFAQTHPDRLATLAHLVGGLAAPALPTCRVLELGCSDGGNLLPMALALPQARFLGIDFSPRQITMGQQRVEALGLRNVELRALDILDLSADLGPFDYIIAHGVFSWVPEEVQERLLWCCRALLAPRGVAYVSYNTYPGCKIREMVRDMVRLQCRDSAAPRVKVQRARALLRFLSEGVPADRTIYQGLLREEQRRFVRLPDAMLLHDDLEAVYAPVFFQEFMERAARHGLQFLSEAAYADMLDTAFAPSVRAALPTDLLEREQQLDFLNGRSFRQTLLCHQDVPLQRGARPERLRQLLVRARFSAVAAEEDLRPGVVQEFRSLEGGRTLGVGAPLMKAALWHLLAAAPRALSITELLQGAQARLADAAPEDELCAMLLAAYGGRLVELHVHQPPLIGRAAEVTHPLVTPLCRMQAAGAGPVTTQWYENLSIEDVGVRRLLQLLDGSRDVESLRGAVNLPGLEALLDRVARFGLLVP